MKNTRPEFIVGNVLDVLANDFEDDSIDLVPTSPPYWGLRDYGGGTEVEWPDGWIGQLGLEPTWQLFVEHLVIISKEIKRVLKPTGSYYLVLGDTYLDKDKLMIPYEVARALRLELGFVRRNDITWRKPNAMPSSVKDRLTCTTERIFHFVKARKYFYDLDAIRKPHATSTTERAKSRGFGIFRRQNMTVRELDEEHALNPAGKNPGDAVETRENGKYGRAEISRTVDGLHDNRWDQYFHPLGKNPGDYWSINTQPFPQAHFAVFPEALIEPIIKSSCPLEVCSACGKARERITEKEVEFTSGSGRSGRPPKGKYEGMPQTVSGDYDIRMGPKVSHHTIGFTKCDCNAEFVPGVVLDPFCGSGTTNLVAMYLGRRSIGIDINPAYIKMAKKRIRKWPLTPRTPRKKKPRERTLSEFT